MSSHVNVSQPQTSIKYTILIQKWANNIHTTIFTSMNSVIKAQIYYSLIYIIKSNICHHCSKFLNDKTTQLHHVSITAIPNIQFSKFEIKQRVSFQHRLVYTTF